jgi:hypothetical protein
MPEPRLVIVTAIPRCSGEKSPVSRSRCPRARRSITDRSPWFTTTKAMTAAASVIAAVPPSRPAGDSVIAACPAIPASDRFAMFEACMYQG